MRLDMNHRREIAGILVALRQAESGVHRAAIKKELDHLIYWLSILLYEVQVDFDLDVFLEDMRRTMELVRTEIF